MSVYVYSIKCNTIECIYVYLYAQQLHTKPLSKIYHDIMSQIVNHCADNIFIVAVSLYIHPFMHSKQIAPISINLIQTHFNHYEHKCYK